MKRYTIIVGIGIGLNFLLNVVFALLFKHYSYLMVAIAIPILYFFVVKSKFFVPKDDVSQNKHIKTGSVLNQIFLLMLGIVISICFFDALIWYGFIGCCVLSVGYTLIYLFCHENLMKISKKYFIVYLFFALLFMFALGSVFNIMPKDNLMIVIGQGAMIYEVFPFIIGGKFIIDILLGLGINFLP